MQHMQLKQLTHLAVLDKKPKLGKRNMYKNKKKKALTKQKQKNNIMRKQQQQEIEREGVRDAEGQQSGTAYVDLTISS